MGKTRKFAIGDKVKIKCTGKEATIIAYNPFDEGAYLLDIDNEMLPWYDDELKPTRSYMSTFLNEEYNNE